MLTTKAQTTAVHAPPTPVRAVSRPRPAWLNRMLRVEWLGQTVASLCWIVSVFVYGVSGAGDTLQLCAASAWLIANLAGLFKSQDA